MHPVGRWNIELVDGVEVTDYCAIKSHEAQETRFLGDETVAANIRNTARRMMVRRIVEDSDALFGPIDPAEKMEWGRRRRRGIILPREYHISERARFSRSISILVIGDSSGSTGAKINGKTKIEYILSSVHSLMKGMDGIAGISTSYGFYSSNGRDDIHFYLGKGFRDPLRYAGVMPSSANRDGAIMRLAGQRLSRQLSDVRIALFINDSMPADDQLYFGARGVADVRHALSELKKAGMLFHIITVPPDKGYYQERYRSQEDYLDELYLDRRNYSVIGSEKELDAAFSAFVKANLPRLRRVIG